MRGMTLRTSPARPSHVTAAPVWGVLVSLPSGSRLLRQWRGNSSDARLGAALACMAGFKAAAVPVTAALLENLKK